MPDYDLGLRRELMLEAERELARAGLDRSHGVEGAEAEAALLSGKIQRLREDLPQADACPVCWYERGDVAPMVDASGHHHDRPGVKRFACQTCGHSEFRTE